jgi:hypothetical protein
MTTSTTMQMSSIDKMMSMCWQENWKEGGGRKWVCSCKTWNLTFLAMKAKASKTTLWDVVCSPPWEQRKRWVPTRSKSWPLAQMQWITPRAKGWGRLNFVHNTKEKTSKDRWKGGMIRRIKAKHLPLSPCKIQACMVWIKNHVNDDVRERLVMQFVWNVLLKLI